MRPKCVKCGCSSPISEACCAYCGTKLETAPDKKRSPWRAISVVVGAATVFGTFALLINYAFWSEDRRMTTDESALLSPATVAPTLATSATSSARVPTSVNEPASAAVIEPSGPGGLGNTRSDIYSAYGEPDTTEIIGSISFADFDNVSAGFALVASGEEQPADRMIDILIYSTTGTTWTMAEAKAVAKKLLPADAESLGPMVVYTVHGIFWDYRQKYHSDALASAVPGDDRIYCGEDPDVAEEPGTFWVKLDTNVNYSEDIRSVQVTTQGCG